MVPRLHPHRLFSDNAMRLWLVAVEKGEPKRVDTNPFGLRDDVLQPAWSPDSKWLAYAKQSRQPPARRHPLLAREGRGPTR
ncbi:MAG: hypothetical protein AB2L07_19100 [Thermoanaerobaculaceae bacterium]